jgi:hypothetical protein
LPDVLKITTSRRIAHGPGKFDAREPIIGLYSWQGRTAMFGPVFSKLNSDG